MSDNSVQLKAVNLMSIQQQRASDQFTTQRLFINTFSINQSDRLQLGSERLLLLLSLEHLQTVKQNSEEVRRCSKTHIYYQASSYIIKIHTSRRGPVLSSAIYSDASRTRVRNWSRV